MQVIVIFFTPEIIVIAGTGNSDVDEAGARDGDGEGDGCCNGTGC